MRVVAALETAKPGKGRRRECLGQSARSVVGLEAGVGAVELRTEAVPLAVHAVPAAAQCPREEVGVPMGVRRGVGGDVGDRAAEGTDLEVVRLTTGQQLGEATREVGGDVPNHGSPGVRLAHPPVRPRVDVVDHVRVGHHLRGLLGQLPDGGKRRQQLADLVGLFAVHDGVDLRHDRLAGACGPEDHRAGHLPGRGLQRCPPVEEQPGGVVGHQHELRVPHGRDRRRGDLERGHDPEVGPGAADCPEQAGQGSCVGAHRRAVGEHHLHGADVVDGQAVLAHQPARPSGGGQPPDPDAAVVAAADAQPVWLQRACDVEPPGARFDVHHARARIGKRDVVHGREVEDDPAVVRRAAGDAVAAAADGEGQVRVLRGEAGRPSARARRAGPAG